MKVLITGASGQLGRALQLCMPAGVDIVPMTHADLDITDEKSIRAAMDYNEPDLIINAAAYTAVDLAESDSYNAYKVNQLAPGLLAGEANVRNVRFVHVSTDFVFDGSKGSPYLPDDLVAPLGVYGASKLAGENAVLAVNQNALILRTAWVYGVTGGNFVRTMLRLLAEREGVHVVADQIGTPTYAGSLALAVWALDAAGARGIHHWTDSGVASWYDFAVAIQEEALALGMLAGAVPVLPVATADFPRPARRPTYSVLDKSSAVAFLGTAPPHWRSNLRMMLKEINDYG